MSCGCSDNNKSNNNIQSNNILSNNNKKLNNANNCNNNKTLSLDSMNYMSIDEIVNLYKNGYVLENSEDHYSNIASLGSYITIHSAVATWSSSSTQLSISCLIENTNTNGAAQFIGYKKYGAGAYAQYVSSTRCVGRTINNYISPLYELINIQASSSRPDLAKIVANNCVAGDGCMGSPTCSTYSYSAELSDMYVDTAVGMNPSPITGLTLAIQSASLYVTWSYPYGAVPVYAYLVRLKQGGTQLTAGYVTSSGFQISALTNGVSYTLEVQAVSDDFYFCPTIISATATPVAPTPILTTITLTAPLPSINIGMTESISAVCRDQNNAIMTCPTLNWTSTTGAVTFDSPGIIRGAVAGTTTIRATSGAIIGQVNVTVNANPANITIQSVTVGGISCTSGCSVTCTPTCPKIVNVVVIWANSGGSNGTFTPKVTVNATVTNGAPITVVPSGTGTTTFTGVSLPQGSPQICIDTGTIT